MKIAITGGIGCGKTTVANEIKAMGGWVLDLDELYHELLYEGSQLCMAIRQSFGNEFFDGEKLNRKKLGEYVFSNPNALNLLNQITHPLILAEMEKRIAPHQTAFVVVPLLVEQGLQRRFDKIWTIQCDTEKRINRVAKRSNLSNEHIQKIIDTQADDQTRQSCADVVLDNNNSVNDLILQVKKAYTNCVNESQEV